MTPNHTIKFFKKKQLNIEHTNEDACVNKKEERIDPM